MQIGILGGGVWGSSLAKLFSNYKVTIFARNTKIIDSINNHHFNPKLKYVVFNNNVSAENNFKLLSNMNIVVIALPAQNIRNALSSIDLNTKDIEIIIASKGIEIQSGLLLSEVIEEITSNDKISILSGPSFSDEVSQNLPTAVTFASKNRNLFDSIVSLIENKNFRMYYSKDLIGCQIGGALKNIYAIASGITMGLNLGENAKSSIITRAFIEINRFGNLLGADKETIFGLSGLGDLILTCNSIKSRNTKFGHLISSNNTTNFQEILKSQQITEGYFTVSAVYKIAKNENIDMPIMKSIYNILYNKYSIKDEINKLLERPTDNEFQK